MLTLPGARCSESSSQEKGPPNLEEIEFGLSGFALARMTGSYWLSHAEPKISLHPAALPCGMQIRKKRSYKCAIAIISKGLNGAIVPHWQPDAA